MWSRNLKMRRTGSELGAAPCLKIYKYIQKSSTFLQVNTTSVAKGCKWVQYTHYKSGCISYDYANYQTHHADQPDNKTCDTLHRPFVAMIAKTYFKIVCVQDGLCTVTERILQLKLYICGPDEGAFHAYEYIIYIYIYIQTIRRIQGTTYINAPVL